MRDKDNIQLLFGASDPDNSSMVMIINDPSHVFIHPKFKDDQELNNLALLKLPMYLKFNQHIDFAAAPIRKNYRHETHVEVILKISKGREGRNERVLGRVIAKLIENDVCSHRVGREMENVLCIEGPDAEHGHDCHRGAGQPVVVHHSDHFVLLGLTIEMGCRVGKPFFVINIESYFKWIKKTIKQNLSDKDTPITWIQTSRDPSTTQMTRSTKMTMTSDSKLPVTEKSDENKLDHNVFPKLNHQEAHNKKKVVVNVFLINFF